MRTRVLIDTNQKVSAEDFLNFGAFPRDSFDSIVGNLLIPDKAFSGFQVTIPGTGAVVNVAKGELWYNGKDFFNDQTGGTNIDLSDRLPSVTKRYVAITAAGIEAPANPQPRTFLEDALTRQTVARMTTTEMRRWVNLSPVSGAVAADPQKFEAATDVVVIAWVLLDPNGVVSVERATENEAPSLREADTRLNAFDEWKGAIGAQLDTLKSDLAGLARKIGDMASATQLVSVQRDMARVKEKLSLPSAFTAYSADYFIDSSQSDINHVDYLAEVQDGVRFPPASILEVQLALLNLQDPLVVTQDNFVLPAYTETPRLNLIQHGAFGDAINGPISIPIAGYPFISGAFFRQLLRLRARFRYGPELPSIKINANYFTQSTGVQNDPVSELFRLNSGEVYNAPTADEEQISLYDPRRLPGVWVDRFKTAGYWFKRSLNFNVSGSGLCQTFFNAQDGWLTSVEFALQQVGASGNMDVFICECDANGVPQARRIISHSVVNVADLKTLQWTPERTTKANIVPTMLFAGQRYGVIVMSSGNHRFWLIQRNKFTQGQLFSMTSDGIFSPVSVSSTGWQINEADLGIRLNFASFNSPRTIVNMQPLTLTGGIGKADVLAEAIIPSQCSIAHEVQVSGNWIELSRQVDPTTHPFTGLPALLPYRIVLNGTTDAMPGIGVGAASRVRTSRPRTDFKHISTARTFPSATTVKAFYRVENARILSGALDAGHQTISFRLMTGAGFTTLTAPTTTVATVAPDDPNALEYALTWTGLAATTTAKFQAFGTSDNALTVYHLSQRTDVE
jgi:hypothetical protein